MNTAPAYSSDVAFTPVVKQLQEHRGSRRSYERMEQAGSWETTIRAELAERDARIAELETELRQLRG